MGPVLEQRPVFFQQLPGMFAPEVLVAGKQDLVVGALDRGKAVDLDKAEIKG